MTNTLNKLKRKKGTNKRSNKNGRFKSKHFGNYL